MVTQCTDWYWLHSLVHLLQPTGYKSTNRVLATQSLLNNAASQLVTKKNNKKNRELLVTVKYRVWSPGTGQSCLRLILVTENS